MPIRYPAGALVHAQFNAETKANIIDGLKGALVDAGMVATGIKAYVILTFTGLPANAQTCTFDGVGYTFKTAIINANPREVLIGATAAACAANLYNCINDTGTGEGTTYSNTTTAHPTCEAVDPADGAALTVRYQTAGAVGNGTTAAEVLNNATLDSSTFRYGGWSMLTGKTPRGLQCRILIDDDKNATMARVCFSSVDGVAVSTDFRLTAATSRTLDVISCQYQFFTFLLGSSTTQGCALMGGVPYIRDAHAAPVVASVSDNGGAFQVMTSLPHGLVTGDHVYISDATKGGDPLPALNGWHQVTVVDTTNYTLDGSTYEVGYDENSAVSGGPGQISRAIWASGDDTGCRYNFRRWLQSSYGGLYLTTCFCALNQYSWSLNGSFSGGPRLILSIPDGNSTGNWGAGAVQNYGNFYDLLEARIAWQISSPSAALEVVGELWAAFVVNGPVTMDITKNNFDGHNWHNYTNAYVNGSLWLAKAIST